MARGHTRFGTGMAVAGIALIVAFLGAMAWGSTGSSEETPAAEPAVTTTAPEPEPTTKKPEKTEEPVTRLKVPDAVGLDYQEAQDIWREAGLIVLPAKDATGANRLPIIDRNWIVVSQNVKPGTSVPKNTPIRATVKKDTDD